MTQKTCEYFHYYCYYHDYEQIILIVIFLSVYSSYGCEYDVELSTPRTSVCVCNHTTSFAALLLPSDIQLTFTQMRFLEYLTLIGMPLSILSLVICIAIFTLIRLVKHNRI